MKDLHGLRAGLYVRVSSDKARGTDLEGISADGQVDEARAVADELGLNVIDVYNDNDRSASKFATKARKNWDRMLADVEAGRLDILVVWESSRGSREFEDWAKFLKLMERHAVLFHVISHERTYDPRNHRDWELLAQDGVKSAAESNLISVRTRRGHAKARRLGRPHGPAPFGWRRVYDPESGKMITQVPVESEQVIVADIYKRVLAGEPPMSIARDLTARSALPQEDPDWVPLTRRGNAWRHDAVKLVALSPVHIGKFYDPKGEMYEGSWESTVEEDDWWGVHRLLTDPARTTTKPGKVKHLLTNIARCGDCSGRMSARIRGGHYRLFCRRVNDDGSPKAITRQVTIRMDWVDDYVEDEMVVRLDDDKLVAKLTERNTAEQTRAAAKAAELRSDLASMWDLVKARKLTAEQYADASTEWEPQIEALEAQAADGLGVGAVLALEFRKELAQTGVPREDWPIVIRKMWSKTPVAGQRELVKTFITSIVICPKIEDLRTFDERRVQID